jgi:predicted amidohydrolase YtcJ
MTVLDDDPYTVDPMEIRNITIWGTVVGGVPYERPVHSS